MKLTLNVQILIGVVIGVIFGFILSTLNPSSAFVHWSLFTCDFIGKITFVGLLKMILIPLVFTSITVGIANLRSHAQMHKVWPTALFYYVSTTALAVILGLIVVNVFKPGVNVEVAMLKEAMASANTDALARLTPSEFILATFKKMFVNPVAAMAGGDILATILFAIFMGIGLIAVGDKAKGVNQFFVEFFEIIMVIVNWIMKIAPYGIACLLAKLIATTDMAIIASMGKFILVVLGATLFHGFVVLPLIALIVTGTHPIHFFKSVNEALITAFSTASSAATLPITMRCVEEDLKVDKDVSGFVLPLGATINMDGTALYEAIAALFIANLVGIELTVAQQIIVFLTSILAAMGAPGIPSAGMVTMIMVLQAVGLPAEAVAILYPIDRFLDAFRTMVNVEGDAIGSLVVQKLTSK